MDKNSNNNIIKRRLQGIIVSDKMRNTVVVKVDVFKKHPRYHKYFTISKKFKAHNEENKYKKGDLVIIEESRPLSKEKRWTVKDSIIKKINEIDL